MSNHDLMPEATFSTFILSLGSSALMHIGEVPNPETGIIEKNPTLAKHTIDLLNMIETKLKDGLDADEEKLFKDILYEVRVKYVAQK